MNGQYLFLINVVKYNFCFSREWIRRQVIAMKNYSAAMLLTMEWAFLETPLRLISIYQGLGSQL